MFFFSLFPQPLLRSEPLSARPRMGHQPSPWTPCGYLGPPRVYSPQRNHRTFSKLQLGALLKTSNDFPSKENTNSLSKLQVCAHGPCISSHHYLYPTATITVSLSRQLSVCFSTIPSLPLPWGFAFKWRPAWTMGLLISHVSAITSHTPQISVYAPLATLSKTGLSPLVFFFGYRMLIFFFCHYNHF